MAKKAAKYLKDAERLYQKGDKRKGAASIAKALNEDFNYPEAWEFLYGLYGDGRSFAVFQQQFALKYFPQQVHLLNPGKQTVETSAEQAARPAPEKRPSLFARLFRRKPKESTPTEAEPVPPPSPLVTPTASPVSLFEAPLPGAREKTAPRNKSSLLTSLPAEPPARNGGPAQARNNGPAPVRNGGPADSPAFNAAPPAATPAWAQPASGLRPSTPVYAPPGDKIKVLVVDDIAQARENIIRSLRFQSSLEVIGTASTGKEAIRLTLDLQPDVVVMDVNMPDMDGITATIGIKTQMPAVQIIILTVQDDVDYMREAMRAGARDFLTKPPVIDELLSAVQHAGEIAQEEKAKAGMSANLPGSPSAASLVYGKIISVYSPKGGVGCSMVAANLAAALHNPENPVVLVDAALQYGDLPVFFNLQAKNSVVDLARHAGELDRELVNEVLAVHASGIKVLAPARLEDSNQITAQSFSAVLKFLRQMFAYVVIDTPHYLTDPVVAALDDSDLVIVVSTQDIPAVASVRKFLDLAPLLNIPRERLLFVMNQYDKRVNIPPEKVAGSLKMEVGAALPLEPATVVPAINRGQPFILHTESLNKPVARAMLTLAQSVRARLAAKDQPASEAPSAAEIARSLRA